MTAIKKAQLIFLTLFVVICGGLIVYQWMYVIPERRCEAADRWWTNKWRACAAPIRLNGRVNGKSLASPPTPPAAAETPAAAPAAAPKAEGK